MWSAAAGGTQILSTLREKNENTNHESGTRAQKGWDAEEYEPAKREEKVHDVWKRFRRLVKSGAIL